MENDDPSQAPDPAPPAGGKPAVKADAYLYYPPRRAGLIFQGGTMAILALLGGWGLWRAAQVPIGPPLLGDLLLAFLALAPLPFLFYRLRALQGAYYILERDGMRLHWGLRAIDIPMTAVLWVRRRGELRPAPALPWLRWPGAILGSTPRPMPGAGSLEYLASAAGELIYIATPGRVYAISPDAPDDFLLAYRQMIELGSLTPLTPRSIHPVSTYAQVWQLRPARWLLLSGGGLSLALLVWVSLAIPQRAQVLMGAAPPGALAEPVPSAGLLLLPLANFVFFGLNWLFGVFFLRREDFRPLAYLLWGVSALLPLLFLGAVAMILNASGIPPS
jgi:hypothetical protein